MRPFSLLIKPAGPDCNLACHYCFYMCKTEMFGTQRHRMSDEVLECLVRSYLGLGFPVNNFPFQGGEPTLMGLDFYKKVVALQKQYGRTGQTVSNALQTNGILLNDDAWCVFLHEYHFLLGISLDGPEVFHDHYRKDHAGRGTWQRVMEAIACCRRHRVEFNILVLLNDRNVKEPDRLFDFFVEQGIEYLQFVPCVERGSGTGEIAPYACSPQEYGAFMCRIFDRWLEYGPTRLSIRLFDSIMHYYLNGQHTNCTFMERCSDYIVIEHNGDAFCCDFFVTEEWKLGNILETPIETLYEGGVKKKFAKTKRKVAQKCFVCRHYEICRGGCLKDRLAKDDNYSNVSYLCEGYRAIFDHALPRLRELTEMLRYQNRAMGGPSIGL